MIDFKVNTTELDEIIAAIKLSGNNVDTNIKDINNPTKCSGIMIKEYYDHMNKISAILTKYKSLIDKDAADFTAAKNKIVQMDSDMHKLY